MRISDWSSDVCSSDLFARHRDADPAGFGHRVEEVLRKHAFAVTFQPVFGGELRAMLEHRVADVLLVGGQCEIHGLESVRSEERRVGKEGVSTCRSRWSTYH